MKPNAPLPFAQLERLPLPERIYRQVHAYIAEGRIDPSRKLTETQLAAMLGVSRTPVREALARLRHEGLLSPGRGAAVVSLTLKDLEEIMELRLLIEPYLAGKAAQTAATERLDDLARIVEVERREAERLAARRGNVGKFVMANHDFRVALLALADNRRLAEAAHRYDSQIQALRRATLAQPEHRDIVVNHHGQLAAALARRDAGAAQAIMRALLEQAREPILALAPAGPRSDREKDSC